MICYKDMTFCDFYMECSDGDSCPRALTPEVKKAATEWGGNENAPIALFVDNPPCFKDVWIKEEKSDDI